MRHPTEGARELKGTPNSGPSYRFADGLLSRHPSRLHLGVLLALALIGLLAFVVVPLRQYRVQVDGVERALRSRQSGTDALLAQAQVGLLAGDDVRRDRAANGSPVVAVERALPVTLEVDGQRLAWRSRAQTVEGALAEASVRLGAFDTVSLNGLPAGARDRIDVPQGLLVARALSLRLPLGAVALEDQSETTLAVRRAVPFALRDGDSLLPLSSGERTVGLALRQRGVAVGPGDLLQPPASAPLTPGLEVVIERAQPVTLSMGGRRVVLYSRAGTVAGVLQEAGLTLAEDQRVYPAPDSPVLAGAQLRVVNVSEESYVESDTIDSVTVYRVDPALADGQTRRVAGSDGTLYREYRIYYEDGQEVSQELVREWYDPEPANTVIYFSAGDRYRATGLPDGLSVVRVLRVYATWYNAASAGKPSWSPSYGITATGIPVTYGIVAVDPRVIPLGTRMYIPGYGYAVAADTGGAVVGNIIDLGYPDGVEPHWTPRWLDIYILGP